MRVTVLLSWRITIYSVLKTLTYYILIVLCVCKVTNRRQFRFKFWYHIIVVFLATVCLLLFILTGFNILSSFIAFVNARVEIHERQIYSMVELLTAPNSKTIFVQMTTSSFLL